MQDLAELVGHEVECPVHWKPPASAAAKKQEPAMQQPVAPVFNSTGSIVNIGELLAQAGFKLGAKVIKKGSDGKKEYTIRTWPMDLSRDSKTIQLVEMQQKGEKAHACLTATMIMDEYEAVAQQNVQDKDPNV